MTVAATVIALGELRPKPAQPKRLTVPNSRRPAQLDDPDWLRSQLAHASETQIAKDLGVSRPTVHAACVRLGVTAYPRGPRRGQRPLPVPPDFTERVFLTRFRGERGLDGPEPSERLLVARLQEAHTARQSGDRRAYRQALLAVASACLLIHQESL